jgi:hypothetical protein
VRLPREDLDELVDTLERLGGGPHGGGAHYVTDVLGLLAARYTLRSEFDTAEDLACLLGRLSRTRLKAASSVLGLELALAARRERGPANMPDDRTPPAISGHYAHAEDQTVIIRHGQQIRSDGAVGALVTFDARLGSLTVVVYPDRQIEWQFTPGTRGPMLTGGVGLSWRFGRLSRTESPDCLAFSKLLLLLGLHWTQFEGELRMLTRYRDGTE